MKYRIRILRWQHPSVETHLLGVLQGFAELADGLVTVLSLGFLMSNFEMSVAFYRGKYHLNRIKNERAKANDI